MADSNVSTDGGTYVERDANTGRDFVGRDNITTNYINPDSLTSDQKLNSLYKYILGSPIDGIIGQAELLRVLNDRMGRMEAAVQEQAESSKERQRAISDEVRKHRQEVEQRLVSVYFWLSVLGVGFAMVLVLELFLILRILS